MSIFSTIAEKGLGTILKGVIGGLPSIYLWIGGAAAIGAALLGVRIWWGHSVAVAAQARIDQYIATQKKDAEQLAEIVLKNNTKIQIQYVDRTTVITKVVHDNGTIIDQKVPDFNTILSDGWVSAFNFSTRGLPIDPVAAAVKTLSGVSATQALDVVNVNNGVCLATKAELDALQAWVTTTKAAVAAQNKKDGAKK
jgi:hypothetical protein